MPAGIPDGSIPSRVLTTLRRGETLEADGYIIKPTDREGIFSVTTPKRWDAKKQEHYTITYTVDVLTPTCNCTQFQEHQVCKHIVGTRKWIRGKRQELRDLLAAMGEIFQALGTLAQLDRTFPGEDTGV